MVDRDDQSGTMSPMRICFVSRALPVHRLGGLEYHLLDLAVALAHCGHQILILTTRGGARDKAGEVQNITIHEIPGTKPGDYSMGFFLRVKKAARDICAKHSIDVLCPIDLAGLFLAPADFPAKVVPLIHGTLTSEVPLDWRYWPHLSPGAKLAALWRFKSRIALLGTFQRMIQRVESIIVDSEFTRRELMFGDTAVFAGEGLRLSNGGGTADGEKAAELARKIHVVPLGIDPERYPVAGASGVGDVRDNAVFKICILGRLQKIKGVEHAILAACALSARDVNFHLTIGGSGDFTHEAKQLVSDLGLNEHVFFVGRVEPCDLSNFFVAHDVFLLPDLSQPAFGLVAVEAMQYGLPVVAANVGAVSEVVGECGWFYDAWDVTELAGLLAHLADHPEEVAQKAFGAREQCLNFTAAKMAQRMEKAFFCCILPD